jgi:hypothetical protein
MFGWFKKHAAQVQQARQDVALASAEDTQKFMLQLSAAVGDMPKKMLTDPFVIGAIASHAAILSKVVSNGQCPQAVTEAAMVTAVQLSFAGASVTREDAIGALYQFKNHPDYTKASQVITLVLGARFGRKDLVNDPLILETRRKVEDLPLQLRESFGATVEEQVAHELSRTLFIQPLREKYGTAWARK